MAASPGKKRFGLFGTLATIIVAVLVISLTGNSVMDVLRDITGQGGSTQPGGPAEQEGPATSAEADEARERLDALTITDPDPRGDYERDEFGSGWVDTDDNGCSTRNDVLARDLEDPEVDTECKVLSGTLADPYTGDTIEFASSDPNAVQIDHVVPLSLAWRMGADEWDRDTRVEFANDFGNLIAVDGPANSQKSDSGPGEWQPYEGYQCSYAVAYIDVTHRYELPVSTEDHQGLTDMLATCA